MASPMLSIAAVFSSHGAPATCLRFARVQAVRESAAHSLYLGMLGAPVNPSDVNAIEGVYPVPAAKACLENGDSVNIGGFEGAAKVLEVDGTRGPARDIYGAEINPGDMVVPAKPSFGTWRSRMYATPQSVINVSALGPRISFREASVLTINPCTAYRLLSNDFIDLQEGDFVIQNAANSAVGRAVIQIGRERGIKTLNVIRDRPDYEKLANELQGLGADIVVKEGELVNAVKKICVKPKLGLNCVSGLSGSDVTRSLGPGGVMVTYGGMSKQPMTVTTTTLLFKEVQMRGFWLTRWRSKHGGTKEERKMFSDLIEMTASGKLRSPATRDIIVDADAASAKHEDDSDLEKAQKNLRAALEDSSRKPFFVFEN